MAVNYDDKRFAEVEAEKKAALAENEKLYGDMVNNTDQYYDNIIQTNEQWAEKQSQLQQEQTDFAIEKIEQQKDQLEDDYHKEQKGAYVDYQKAIDPYGVNAEQMAANGLKGSGYAESSKVAMYTAYQNRVAVAKASFDKAVIEYDNMINEARLQNNAALAEIAYSTLEKKTQLMLENFQYKNSLLAEKANQATSIDQMYYGRRQDVLNQINTENALEEEKRQFNKNLSLQYAQLEEEKRQFDVEQSYNNLIIKEADMGILSKSEFSENAITVGSRGNTGNGGYNVDGVRYKNYDEYVYSKLENAFNSGSITEDELNQLLDKYGF